MISPSIPVSRSRSVALAVLASFTVSLPAEVVAAPSEFTAIRVDAGLVYIDVGRRNGVAPGQALEVVAREGNDDAFHLGWIVLESCGESISLAHVPADLVPYVKTGTILRLPGSTGALSSPPAPSPHSLPSATSAPPRAVQPPSAPGQPAALAITIATPAHSAAPAPTAAGLRHDPPSLVAPGVPLTLSVYAPPPLATPILMYRSVGDHTYRARAFKPQPDAYYVVTVPPEEVQAPGLEYYIIVDAPDAPRRLAFATPEDPTRVAVEGRFNQTTELARYGVRDEVSANSELVTYHLGNGTSDYYYRLEGDYLHRIFEGVYSMRFGAGYLSGVATDGSAMRTQVGFLYAYSESEFRNSGFPIAFIPRLIFGVNNNGVGGGFEARVRLGDELGMNFESGITVLSRLGFETFTALTLHPTARAAVALAAYLEDLPLANSLGFRSYVDLKYRVQRALWVTLRLGVAARSIDTIGPDTGLAMTWGF